MTSASTTRPLVGVEDVTVRFDRGERVVHAGATSERIAVAYAGWTAGRVSASRMRPGRGRRASCLRAAMPAAVP